MTKRNSTRDGNRRVARATAERRAEVRRTQVRVESADVGQADLDGEADIEANDDVGYSDAAVQPSGRKNVASVVGGISEPQGPGNVRTSAKIPESSTTRQGMGARGVGNVLRAIFAFVLIGGVTVVAAYGAYRYAQTSPRFAIRQIEVDGLRRVTREAILSGAGIRAGQNVFSIDTDAVGRKILVERWLQEVKVERRLPATVRIKVVERDAGALAMMGDDLLVVTRAGEPFKRFESGDPTDLPVITGVSLDEPGREPAVEKRRIATALEVLRHFERMALSRTYPAEEVHLSPGGEVVLTIGKVGIALHLGVGPWAKKLAMAERVLSKMQGRKGSVAMVFLDNRAHPERVVVRMR